MRYWQVIDGAVAHEITGADYRPDPDGPTYPHPGVMDAVMRLDLGIAVETSQPDGRWYASFTRSPATVNGELVVAHSALVPHATAILKARKKEDAARLRYDAENGGIEVSGMPVQTDQASQTKIMAARILAKEDANYTVKWKTAAGFVELNATQIIAVADAVRAHVQACFDAEADHIDAIDDDFADDGTDDAAIIAYEVSY